MDIRDFTEKFVIEKLWDVCNNNDFCIDCPFYNKSIKSLSNCKLIQLDENLVRDRETPIWSRRPF